MPWGRKTVAKAVQADERATWLACIPICLTGCFYLLPASTQQNLLLQFLPQLAGYGALVIWWKFNADALPALGFSRSFLKQGVRVGDRHGVYPGVGQLDRDSVDRAGSWWRRSIFGRHAACQGAPLRDDSLVHGPDRNRSRVEFSRISPGQTGVLLLPMDFDGAGKRSPAWFDRGDTDFGVGVCIRSFYGDDVSASPLDRGMGRTHLGSPLFAVAEPGDGDCGPCH